MAIVHLYARNRDYTHTPLPSLIPQLLLTPSSWLAPSTLLFSFSACLWESVHVCNARSFLEESVSQHGSPVSDSPSLSTFSSAEALAEPRAHHFLCFQNALSWPLACWDYSGPPLPSGFYVSSRALTPSSVCAASTLPIEQSPHSNLGFLYWLTHLSLAVVFGMGFRCTYVERMFESLLAVTGVWLILDQLVEVLSSIGVTRS